MEKFNNIYSIDYVMHSDIESIKTIWEKLYCNGKDMTTFQSYSWHYMLSKVVPIHKNIDCFYAVVRKSNTPILIAPLLVNKKNFRFVNKKGCYLLGAGGWTDYNNLVYDDFCEDALDYLFQEIIKKYGIHSFHFADVPDSSAFAKYLLSKYEKNILSVRDNACVGMVMAHDWGGYWSNLSKSSKQNIRTANNRAAKDGIRFVFDLDDKSVDKQLCQDMREKRLTGKIQRIPFRVKVKRFILRLINRNKVHYRLYHPFYDDTESKMMTIKNADSNELCAYFCYRHDNNKVYLITAGTNEKYARYSPGILLMCEFIKSHIDRQDISYLDFTRGNEKYKYQLGGKDVNEVTIGLEI